MAKYVEVQIGAHKDNKVNPGAVFGALGQWAMRGAESPVLRELSDRELKALEEEDLLALIRGFFGHERRVGYAGTRSAAELGKFLSSPGGGAYRPAPAKGPRRYLRPKGHEVLFAHRDMVQSQVGLFTADEVYDPESTWAEA